MAYSSILEGKQIIVESSKSSNSTLVTIHIKHRSKSNSSPSINSLTHCFSLSPSNSVGEECTIDLLGVNTSVSKEVITLRVGGINEIHILRRCIQITQLTSILIISAIKINSCFTHKGESVTHRVHIIHSERESLQTIISLIISIALTPH